MKSDPMQRKLPSSFEKWNQFVSPEPHLTDCARTALPVENLPCICALRAAVRCSGAAMNGLRALSRYSRRLPPSNPQARALQTLLQTCLTWQQPTASRAYSAEADDDGKGSPSPANPRGSWRSWVEQQLSGIDKAMLSNEQKAAQEPQQMQPQQQQQQQQQPQQQQQQVAAQQSAQVAGQEEVAEQISEERLEAQDPTADSPQPDTEAAASEEAFAQPSQLAQEHAADPQEPQQSPTTLTTAADEEVPPEAESQLTDVPAGDRLQILLEAIRNRAWEQTEEEKASAAKLQESSMQLPASGYSEIGAISEGRFQGQMLNPERTFYPGQSYNPEDLIPAPESALNIRRPHRMQVEVAPKTPSNKEVLRTADFRDLQFLDRFVTDGGQIVSRQKTKLQSKVHRHLARQIKTARVMALLPHAGRAPQFDVNAKFDVQDDDFSPDGEVDEITFVKQALQARRQHRDQNPDPRLR